MIPGAATTRDQHTRAKTNALLNGYDYDLRTIVAAFVHQIAKRDRDRADVAADVDGAVERFRLETAWVADELAVLYDFAAGGRSCDMSEHAAGGYWPGQTP